MIIRLIKPITIIPTTIPLIILLAVNPLLLVPEHFSIIPNINPINAVSGNNPNIIIKNVLDGSISVKVSVNIAIIENVV